MSTCDHNNVMDVLKQRAGDVKKGRQQEPAETHLITQCVEAVSEKALKNRDDTT